MSRIAAVALLVSVTALPAVACTCVSSGAKTAKPDAPIVFRGVVIKSDLLPRHPAMRGRQGYVITFQVQEQWKGVESGQLTLYDLDPGTDCIGAGFTVGQEYLVYARTTVVQDYSLDDYFWYGWTDVLAKGTSMIEPVACVPGGPTTLPSVRKALRDLGRGSVPHRK